MLAGLGDIALSAHLPALARNSGVRVLGLVDPDEHRRELARALLPAPAFADLAEVLDDPEVRGVVLATPPWVTTGLIPLVTATGRFVLAEKPVATSVRAAGVLAELPEPQRGLVQVGLTYRHDPAMELLHDWITGGRLGSPSLVRAQIYDERRDPADPAHAGRIEGTLRHGMPVVHEGAHVFDWFGYLLGGPPDRVADAWAVATRPDLPAPNLCGARLEYPPSGGQGTPTVVLAEFGWLTDALPRCEISVLGDRGHALLDGQSFRLELSTAAGLEQVAFEPERTTRCFDRQLVRFVDLITGASTAPAPDLADGLAALELAERVAVLAGESPR